MCFAYHHMSWGPLIFEQYLPTPMQTLCLGTIIAASFTRHKLLDIKHNTNLSSTIKDELLVKTEATAAVAISASVITIAEGIGMTVIMIVLYLIKDMKFSGILESLATILVRTCTIIIQCHVCGYK